MLEKLGRLAYFTLTMMRRLTSRQPARHSKVVSLKKACDLGVTLVYMKRLSSR